MEQFRVALDAFVRGDLPQAELDAALRSALELQPEAGPDLLALLQASYQAGQMPAEVFAAMGERLAGQHAANSDQVDDRTRMRAGQAAAPDDDRTRVAAPGAGEEATVMAPSQTAGDGDVTGSTSPSGSTGGTGATGATWGDPALWADGPSDPPRVGMTLKNRFVLESVVGRGGMGVVFKARDLRKEEAQDRNPYLAVKVLNEEFKRHPDSLKALQRESRKAQNLAHPNIVTVYDFDRDGATVYMTMEYLEGEPLDRLIKRDWPQGMPLKEALPIIEGMGQALAYAHQKGVVHSDFKPGNVFLTPDGTVKVFDFGIAQATKHAGTDAGEQTLFDAGTLGALTPSYASVEMLEGGEPDPRDDIYALACASYQLLTGRHPFDKRPATDARDRKLSPRPVAGLSRRQWRALAQGLA
ncbi:MAG: serine/threonine-protein kinase, partial [Gammaproteobacteria bacterium]